MSIERNPDQDGKTCRARLVTIEGVALAEFDGGVKSVVVQFQHYYGVDHVAMSIGDAAQLHRIIGELLTEFPDLLDHQEIDPCLDQ